MRQPFDTPLTPPHTRRRRVTPRRSKCRLSRPNSRLGASGSHPDPPPAAGARAGYAIVAGPPLKLAAGARAVMRDRVRYAVLPIGGTTIVTWRRRGRTCVLASREASAQALLAMAAWQPDEGSQERY